MSKVLQFLIEEKDEPPLWHCSVRAILCATTAVLLATFCNEVHLFFAVIHCSFPGCFACTTITEDHRTGKSRPSLRASSLFGSRARFILGASGERPREDWGHSPLAPKINLA